MQVSRLLRLEEGRQGQDQESSGHEAQVPMSLAIFMVFCAGSIFGAVMKIIDYELNKEA